MTEQSKPLALGYSAKLAWARVADLENTVKIQDEQIDKLTKELYGDQNKSKQVIEEFRKAAIKQFGHIESLNKDIAKLKEENKKINGDMSFNHAVYLSDRDAWRKEKHDLLTEIEQLKAAVKRQAMTIMQYQNDLTNEMSVGAQGSDSQVRDNDPSHVVHSALLKRYNDRYVKVRDSGVFGGVNEARRQAALEIIDELAHEIQNSSYDDNQIKIVFAIQLLRDQK